MISTTAIKTSNKVPLLKQEIAESLPHSELNTLDEILNSKSSLQEFKDKYFFGSTLKNESFSQENIYFICDKLR